jgi:hypothetical protein
VGARAQDCDNFSLRQAPRSPNFGFRRLRSALLVIFQSDRHDHFNAQPSRARKPITASPFSRDSARGTTGGAITSSLRNPRADMAQGKAPLYGAALPILPKAQRGDLAGATADFDSAISLG